MKNFHRDDRSGGRGDRDSRRPTTMFQATCADCGKKCEVPFRPTGDRPVYCSACFGQHSDTNPGRSSGRSFGRPSFDRPSFGDRPKFQAVCAKCGQKCEVPFRPTGDKPIYCNDCFDKGGAPQIKHTGYSSDQLTSISAKLDKILAILSPVTGKKAEEKKIAAAPKEEKNIKEESKPKKEKKTAEKVKPAEKKKTAKKKK